VSRKNEPFRLRAGEPLGAAVERIARHEIEDILHHLEGGARDDDAVHEIRKATNAVVVARTIDRLGERGGDDRATKALRPFRRAVRAHLRATGHRATRPCARRMAALARRAARRSPRAPRP